MVSAGLSAGKSADAVLGPLQGNCLLVVADGWPGGGSQGVGDGGQRESDDRRYPIALTEDHKETANGLPPNLTWPDPTEP